MNKIKQRAGLMQLDLCMSATRCVSYYIHLKKFFQKKIFVF